MALIINPDIRLITLIGPGGIGKTSCALDISHQLVGVFPHGVFFVPCFPAQTPDQIYQFIAESTGLVFTDQNNLKKQLLDHLRYKEMLLVLDNFEHLLGNQKNIRVVDEILQNSIGLTILITSRERLNLQQEHLFNLSGLNYPSENSIPTENIDDYDALRLFSNRAVQLQKDFLLNEKNLAAVIKICQVLEGLPLGIELAAAAAWEHGIDQIAHRIKNDLDIVSADFYNIHPRHRNLRVIFDVSWEMLSQDEQDALSICSIFQGGFDRAALRYINPELSSKLPILVSKSLVRTDEYQRFYLHEIIRQFSAEKLINSGKFTEIQINHAKYYAFSVN